MADQKGYGLKRLFTNYLLKSIFGLLFLAAPSSAADVFDGLYYSINSPPPATCSAIKNETYVGGLIIEKSVMYHYENACELQHPKKTVTGTEFIAQCESEGEPYRQVVTIEPTTKGLEMTSGQEATTWVRCLDNQSRSSPGAGAEAHNWSVKSYSDGTIERTLSNTSNDQIMFSCKNGGDGSILAMLSSQEFFGGNIEFDVDGRISSLITWADSIEINTECRVCADHYTGLMQDIRIGKSMTLTANGGKPVRFDIAGAAKVFGSEVCPPKGW